MAFVPPQNVMMPAANRNWWEPAVNQTSNMLSQLVIAKMAHNMRMEEQELALKKEDLKIKAQDKMAAIDAGQTPVSNYTAHLLLQS